MFFFKEIQKKAENSEKRQENAPKFQSAMSMVEQMAKKYKFRVDRHVLQKGDKREISTEINSYLPKMLSCVNENTPYFELKELCTDMVSLATCITEAKWGKATIQPQITNDHKSALAEAYLYLYAIQEYQLVKETGEEPDLGESYSRCKNCYKGYYFYLKCRSENPRVRYEMICGSKPPKIRRPIPALTADVEEVKKELFPKAIASLENNYEKAGQDLEALKKFANTCKKSRKELRAALPEQYVAACVRLERYEDACEFEINPLPFAICAERLYGVYKKALNQQDFQKALQLAKTAKQLSVGTAQEKEISLRIEEILDEGNDPVNSMSILDLLNQAKK